MNRRHFLTLSTLATAGLALDPERLLWRPRAHVLVAKPWGEPLRAQLTNLFLDGQISLYEFETHIGTVDEWTKLPGSADIYRVLLA